MHFFSACKDLIVVNRPLPYDLFINSSRARVMHYMLIYQKGNILSKNYLEEIYTKYHQIYLQEEDRCSYLQGIKGIKGHEIAKVEFCKGESIRYLDDLFKQKEISNNYLENVIYNCYDTIALLLDTVRNKNILQMQDLLAQISLHDFYTYDHSVNVSFYALSILPQVYPQASEKDQLLIALAGLFHDIGKLNVPAYILNIPGSLSAEELAIIKKHPQWGAELLEGVNLFKMKIDLALIMRIILEHHENYDGTGYPFALNYQKIHQYSKIMAIADFYDAITTKRSYADPLSSDEAIALIAKSVGKKIDPFTFLKFQDNVSRFLHIYQASDRELSDQFDPCVHYISLPYKNFSQEIRKNIYKKVI